jgi:hypothetical protein
VTLLLSHILVEAVTDTEIGLTTQLQRPLAWYDPTNGEIGDICNQQQGTVAGYTVQREWSNVSNACIVTVPGLPICDDSSARCRPCYASDDGQDGGCTGSTPVCRTDADSAAFGRCVACVTNAQCPGATPTCDATTNSCRVCAGDQDCAGGTCTTSGPGGGTCTPPPPTTTTTPTGTTPTTTLPVCTGARCSIDEALTGPCAGQTIPFVLAQRFDQAVSLVDRAASASPKKVRALRRKARMALGRARKAATKAGRGKHPKLTAACVQAIDDALTRVASGLSS